MKVKLILLLGVSLLTQTLFAQNKLSTINVKGVVVDSNNNPISLVAVTASRLDVASIRATTTDQKGKFEFAELSSDYVELNISCIGFKSKIINLENRSNYDLGAITLSDSLLLLDEVSVKASKILFGVDKDVMLITDSDRKI